MFELQKLPQFDAVDGIHVPQPCNHDKVASLQNSLYTYTLPSQLGTERNPPGPCDHLDEEVHRGKSHDGAAILVVEEYVPRYLN